MEQKELVKQLSDFLRDKESVDGNAAPALHLMRHALVALERPVVEVRQDILEDNHEAEVLRDQLAEREGFLYGLLGELQLIPEVDGEPVDTLADAIAEDITILESLHGEIVNLFTRWNESPDTARDREKFIAAACALLNLPSGTPLLDIWHALEAKAQYLASLERGIAERDQVIEALENGAHVINVPDYENKLPGWAGVAGDQWRGDALDLAHAVAKDKSLGNRLMAKAAEQLIADAKVLPNG